MKIFFLIKNFPGIQDRRNKIVKKYTVIIAGCAGVIYFLSTTLRPCRPFTKVTTFVLLHSLILMHLPRPGILFIMLKVKDRSIL